MTLFGGTFSELSISAYDIVKSSFLLAIIIIVVAWRRHLLIQFRRENVELLTQYTNIIKYFRYWSASLVIALGVILLLDIQLKLRQEDGSVKNNATTIMPPLPPTQQRAQTGLEAQGSILEQIYQGQDSRENQLDLLKQRYEELFVTYYFLKRCGVADANDFHIINKSLFDELVRLNTPATLQMNILSAAKGSYDEMYSQSPCNSQVIASLEQQYLTYMDQLRKLNNAAEALESQ